MKKMEKKINILFLPSPRSSRNLHSTMWLIVLLSMFAAISASLRLSMSYREVQELGNSCPNLDSCNHKRSSGSRELDTVAERNCACDYMCEEFNDCCVDAPNFGNSRLPVPTSGWKCYELRQFGGVYMKGTCDHYTDNQELINLCENSKFDDFSDPLGSMPATDVLTGLTYKNYYCGICNGNNDNLVLWTPRLECPTLTFYNKSRRNLTQEFVKQNLIFDGSSWGLYLDGENGSLFFHDCVIDPVMPHLLESKIRLCKIQAVSTCPDEWTDETVRDKCEAYTGLRYLHSESYRNIHCAVCNGVNTSLLTCHSVEYREMFVFRTFVHHAFSLLLDINERQGQYVGFVKKCEDGEVFDPFFKKCRSLVCLPGSSKLDGVCVSMDSPSSTSAQEDAAITSSPIEPIISADNNTNVLETLSNEKNASYVVISSENTTVHDKAPEKEDFSENITGTSYNTSMIDADKDLEQKIGRFKNCLLISLNPEDYLIFENKTIYVPEYDKLYEPTHYFSADGSVLICSHFDVDPEEKFSAVMEYVTAVGLGFSLLCLLLHFCVFCLVPDLRNLSGKNLMSQCVALFAAYCSYIAGTSPLSQLSCTIVGFLTFYFFQASFFWMNAMAFDVWRTLKMATTELRVTTGRQSKRFMIYSVYSWGLPALVVGLAALAEYTDVFPSEYRPLFAQPRCWFNKKRALLSFFAIPLFAVVLSNIILFASSAKMIVMTTKTTIKQQSPSQKRNFKLYLRLFILMGLTWGAGLLAGYVDTEFLWYLFIVLNTLQGLFIFVSFSCTSKSFSYLRDRLARFTKDAESRTSGIHSSTSHSGSNSNSITALTSILSPKSSSKLLMPKKNLASPTNSSASNSSRHGAGFH